MTVWTEHIEKAQKSHLKSFKDYYEGVINDKVNSCKLLGKVIEKMFMSDEEGMIIQFSSENSVFIKEMKKLLQMNFTFEMSDKILLAF